MMAAAQTSYLPLGERRTSGRFPIDQAVRYKVLESRGAQRIGVGKTLDISSGGILFTTEDDVPIGKRVEIAVDWPAKLDGSCRLKLVARGKIVRSARKSAALRIEKYEFRTQGTRGLE